MCVSHIRVYGIVYIIHVPSVTGAMQGTDRTISEQLHAKRRLVLLVSNIVVCLPHGLPLAFTGLPAEACDFHHQGRATASQLRTSPCETMSARTA